MVTSQGHVDLYLCAGTDSSLPARSSPAQRGVAYSSLQPCYEVSDEENPPISQTLLNSFLQLEYLKAAAQTVSDS